MNIVRGVLLGFVLTLASVIVIPVMVLGAFNDAMYSWRDFIDECVKLEFKGK